MPDKRENIALITRRWDPNQNVVIERFMPIPGNGDNTSLNGDEPKEYEKAASASATLEWFKKNDQADSYWLIFDPQKRLSALCRYDSKKRLFLTKKPYPGMPSPNSCCKPFFLGRLESSYKPKDLEGHEWNTIQETYRWDIEKQRYILTRLNAEIHFYHKENSSTLRGSLSTLDRNSDYTEAKGPSPSKETKPLTRRPKHQAHKPLSVGSQYNSDETFQEQRIPRGMATHNAFTNNTLQPYNSSESSESLYGPDSRALFSNNMQRHLAPIRPTRHKSNGEYGTLIFPTHEGSVANNRHSFT